VIVVKQVLKSYKRIKQNADSVFLDAWFCPVVQRDRLDLSSSKFVFNLVFALHKNGKYKSSSVNNEDSVRLKIQA